LKTGEEKSSSARRHPRGKIMENPRKTIKLILKAVALAMAIASIVTGFFPGETTVETHITLLSIGLTALAIAALQKEE
jgi:hypothetical protein